MKLVLSLGKHKTGVERENMKPVLSAEKHETIDGRGGKMKLVQSVGKHETGAERGKAQNWS